MYIWDSSVKTQAHDIPGFWKNPGRPYLSPWSRTLFVTGPDLLWDKPCVMSYVCDLLANTGTSVKLIQILNMLLPQWDNYSLALHSQPKAILETNLKVLRLFFCQWIRSNEVSITFLGNSIAVPYATVAIHLLEGKAISRCNKWASLGLNGA